jgi:2-methylcitrate dehydratase PrpD
MSAPTPIAPPLTARLVAHAHAPADAAAREAAAAVVLDTIAVGLGAFAHEAAQIDALQRVLLTGAGRGGASVLGTTEARSPALSAALNAVTTHAIDYDDTYMEGGVKTHISAIVVPAALATAEHAGASGAALLDAVVAGFETEARLGHAVTPVMVQRWHPTGTLGPIGAAAAAGRLLNLTGEQMEAALGFAADAAAGTRVCLAQGDATKSLHAALAVRTGIEAAMLAAAGLPGPRAFMETPLGYLASYVGGFTSGHTGPDGFRIHDTSIKFFPAMHALHAAIEALIAIARERPVRSAAEVGAIVVTQSTTHAGFGTARDPATPLGARLSLPFTAAVTLLDGCCDFPQFDAKRLRDGEVGALSRKVSIEASAALEASHPDRIASGVRVEFADGGVISRFVADPRGTPLNRASLADVEAKARALLAPVGPPPAADALIAAVRGLAQSPTLAALSMALAAFARRH